MENNNDSYVISYKNVITSPDMFYDLIKEDAENGDKRLYFYMYLICSELNKHDEAFKWSEKDCIENNRTKSCLEVAYNYLLGVGVERNLEIAAKLYKKIDDVRAYFVLGKLHESGYGVKKNLAKADSYFKKGAKQFHVYSIRDYALTKNNFIFFFLAMWGQFLYYTFKITLKITRKFLKTPRINSWLATRLEPVWVGWGDKKMTKELDKELEQIKLGESMAKSLESKKLRG